MGKRYIERVTKQMPKCSEEFVSSRKEEIINACASLYETMGFREITLGDIGEKTSFTRTSIYNYFQTKEEIFLALLQREHEAWASDLEDIYQKNDALTAAGFADAVARSLEKRECMLKLMAMNLYDLEGGSRMENLVAFKKSYAGTLQAVTRCLEKFFPRMTAAGRQEFLYMLFPFLFGIYPYTSATPKQKEAMEMARIRPPRYSIYDITSTFLTRQLRDFQQEESRS